jgi:hypothetical protein
VAGFTRRQAVYVIRCDLHPGMLGPKFQAMVDDLPFIAKAKADLELVNKVSATVLLRNSRLGTAMCASPCTHAHRSMLPVIV